MQHKRRLDWDIVRTWLCNAVMLGHVFAIVIPYYGRDALALSTVLAMLAATIKLNVPGFVFLAGYFALYRKKTFDSRYFLKSRLRSTMPLYALFSAIYLWLYTQEDLLKLPFYLISGNANYQLYFVPIVLQLYLLTPLLAKAVRSKPRLTLALSAGISYGFCALIALTHHPSLTMFYWCAPYLVYYVWGLVAGDGGEAAWTRKQRVCLTLLFFFSSSAYGFLTHRAAYDNYFPLAKPGYTLLLYALEYIKNILGIIFLRYVAERAACLIRSGSLAENILLKASGHSYLVYLAHPLLLEWLSRYIVRAPERLFPALLSLMWLCVAVYGGMRQLWRSLWQRRSKDAASL